MASPVKTLLLAGLLTISLTTSAPAQSSRSLTPTNKHAYVAKILQASPTYKTPSTKRPTGHRLSTRSLWAKQSQQLLVLQRHTDTTGRQWLQVQLPTRPNGSRAWILARRTIIHRTGWRILITLHTRHVQVFYQGRLRSAFDAVIGKASTPTPRGHFAVYEKVRQSDPQGFLGPWALHLTASSNVLDNYGGGPGRVAIHGRDGASLLDPLGTARSHGCVRITNRAIKYLARHIQPGTPVTIRQ